MVTKGKKEGWTNYELEINIYILIYVKEINNKILSFTN